MSRVAFGAPADFEIAAGAAAGSTAAIVTGEKVSQIRMFSGWEKNQSNIVTEHFFFV